LLSPRTAIWQFDQQKKYPTKEYAVETLLTTAPVFAAIGYSMVYLLAGGGLFGAFVIFVVAKMLGR